MDIWHRVGRIVRFSNLGTLLFFTLNILLIVAVFGSSGSIVELICIYFFTVLPFGKQKFLICCLWITLIGTDKFAIIGFCGIL